MVLIFNQKSGFGSRTVDSFTARSSVILARLLIMSEIVFRETFNYFARLVIDNFEGFMYKFFRTVPGWGGNYAEHSVVF